MWRTVRGSIDRWVTDRVILALGWLWFLVYAYPGYMSYDSTWQLAQARGVEPINEWQPPVMAVLWRYLDDIIAGPFLMLVLQSVLFLGGSYVLLCRVMRPRTAALIAVILLVVPQNITIMAVIWKDSQMAGFLVAAIAALFSAKRGWRIFGYVCLFLATGVRYNAAAATFPIVLFQLGYGGTWTKWRRLALACAAWVGLTVASFGANALLTERHMHPWPCGAAPVDIAGTIRYSPHLDNDQLLRDTAGVPWHKTDKIQIRVRTWYHPENQFLNVTEEPGQVFDYPGTDEQQAAITAAWKKLVFAHPWAFLHHRWSVFRAQLADNYAGAGGVYSGFTNDVYQDLLGHRAVHSKLQAAWVHAMEWFDGTPLYHVGIYFVLSILLLPLCRRDRLSALILLSGIAHELGLFAVAPAIDYRYSQWMVACALLGLVTATASRRSRPG
jgi:hypothetical protein